MRSLKKAQRLHRLMELQSAQAEYAKHRGLRGILIDQVFQQCHCGRVVAASVAGFSCCNGAFSSRHGSLSEKSGPVSQIIPSMINAKGRI
jgi:hypothetical protein